MSSVRVSAHDFQHVRIDHCENLETAIQVLSSRLACFDFLFLCRLGLLEPVVGFRLDLYVLELLKTTLTSARP